jgi:hypothetical protein
MKRPLQISLPLRIKTSSLPKSAQSLLITLPMPHSGGQGELLQVAFSEDYEPFQKALAARLLKIALASADGKDGASK